MEDSDYKALDHPEEYILNKGGYILMALLHGESVGACALIKMDNDTFELAKMAVAPKAKGRCIGWLLGNAAISKHRRQELNSCTWKVIRYYSRPSTCIIN